MEGKITKREKERERERKRMRVWSFFTCHSQRVVPPSFLQAPFPGGTPLLGALASTPADPATEPAAAGTGIRAILLRG